MNLWIVAYVRPDTSQEPPGYHSHNILMIGAINLGDKRSRIAVHERV